MNNIYKVSIIVAIFKSEPFLDKLIQSIISQTYKNIEIILVNDGSPDNSKSICEKYAKQDNRVVFIDKENGGACAARNDGMSVATGDYLMFVDGDDWLADDYVEYLLSLVLLNNSDMALSDRIFTTRDQKQIDKDEIKTISNEEAAARIIYNWVPIGPWNKIYKTSLIRDNNISFSVPWSGEGLYFSSMAAQYANHVTYGHRKVYNYRLNNPNSGLTNYNVQMGINALANIKNIGKHLVIKTRYLKYAVKWHIWKNYGFLLYLILATNSTKKMKKDYIKCRLMMKMMLPSIILHCDLSIGTKKGIIKKSMVPVKFFKKQISQDLVNLANDKTK